MTFNSPVSHQDAWDLIPWLINGTMTTEEQEALQAHLATCQDCSAELARQQHLNDAVNAFDIAAPSQDPALDNIAHRLTTQKPRKSAFGWIRHLADGLMRPSGIALGGALAAAALAVIVLSLSLFEPRFETLTSPQAVVDGVEVRLRFQPNADPAAIRALMSEAGASDIAGPSDTGLMRGVVDRDLAEAIVEQLRSDPRVVFIAKDQ